MPFLRNNNTENTGNKYLNIRMLHGTMRTHFVEQIVSTCCQVLQKYGIRKEYINN